MPQKEHVPERTGTAKTTVYDCLSIQQLIMRAMMSVNKDMI